MFLVVQSVDRRLGFAVRRHLDEPESLAPTGITILNDLGAGHVAECAEHGFQLGIAAAIRQIPDIQTLAHTNVSCNQTKQARPWRSVEPNKKGAGATAR
jgi:hypothetical protein